MAMTISQQLDKASPDLLRYSIQKMLANDICDIKKSRDICERDIKYILQYLSQAVEMDSPILFRDFMAWLTDVLINKKIPMKHIRETFHILREGIDAVLSRASAFDPYFESAEKSFMEAKESTEAEILPSDKEILGQYVRHLIRADRKKARESIFNELQKGLSVRDIYLNVFEPAQHIIGRLWQSSIISVAQEHYATAVTQMIMSELYPQIFTSEKNGRKLASFSVGSELHELGIRMVTDFFEMEGWDTSFYGANAPIPDMMKTLKEETFDVIAVSTTMMVHLKTLNTFIQEIRDQDPLNTMKVLVGGYPFLVDDTLWKKVGADGTSRNAESAVSLVSKWFNS